MDVGSTRIETESVTEVLSQTSETKNTEHLSRIASRESVILRSSNQCAEFAGRRVAAKTRGEDIFWEHCRVAGILGWV